MQTQKSVLTCIVGLFAFIGVSLGYGCLEYGAFATSTFDGQCQCMNGYTRGKDILGNVTCVSEDRLCKDEFGYNAESSGNGYCACKAGYVMRENTYGGGSSCVSEDESCQDEFGYSAESSGNGYCTCKKGYLMDDTIAGKKCVLGDTYCTNNHGFKASFNYFQNICECDEGYELVDGTCKEKAYSTYAYLSQLKGSTAIVSFKKPDSILNQLLYYKIDFSIGCSKVSDFIGKAIVLNLLYDKKLNYGDYLILPETTDINGDNQHCKITSTYEVDENEHLYTCQELFGDYSILALDGKCACEDGYEFDGNECIESNTNYQARNYNQNNIDTTLVNALELELTNAIQWMYKNDLTKYANISEFDVVGELTREQASKFFSQFSTKVLGKTLNKDGVEFKDLSSADITLQPFITIAGALGLFQGTDGNFLPLKKLTQAQAVAVIIRTKYGFQNENSEKRYSEYYRIANDNGLLEGLGFQLESMDDKYIQRGIIAILLYRIGNLLK